MNKKQIAIIFASMLFSTVLTALILHFVIRQTGPLLPAESVTPSLQYAFGMVCVFSSLLGAFLALRQTRWNPLVRMSLLTTPALLVIIDYYLLRDSNFIYCLPLLFVASLMLFYKVMQD